MTHDGQAGPAVTAHGYDDIFPTRPIEFEGLELAGPHAALSVLKQSFGDYY